MNGQPYAGDPDGNTLTGGGRTNAWDSQNRLLSSIVNGTSSAFTYGADGLRRSSTVTPSGGSPTTTRYAYDGQTMVRSLRQNAQGVWQAAATYLTGPRGMEYRRDDLAGTVRWYVYDGLGSVVGELDPSGNLTAGKKYDVYGAERTGGTGTATTRQGFCGSLGHVADAETGLVYMKARYYDPNIGRFVSEDPSLNGMNWFVYCNDNPINQVDKDGKEAQEWNTMAFNLGLDLGLIAVLCAWAASQEKGAGAYSRFAMAGAAIAFSTAATVCFGIAMAGLTNATQDVLLALQAGLFTTLATMVTFAGTAGNLNLPGVYLAVGGAFNYGLIALSLIATSDGDY